MHALCAATVLTPRLHAPRAATARRPQPLLAGMLSAQPSARPSAAAFAGCQWFSDDMLLRCLKFLDNILQRESGQKVRGANVRTRSRSSGGRAPAHSSSMWRPCVHTSRRLPQLTP